jgi:hypothetical protein
MTMRRSGTTGGLAGVALLLAGCGPAARQEAPRVPAMPTVGAAPSAPAPDERERRALAEIIALARQQRAAAAREKIAAVADPAVRDRIAVQAVRAVAEGEPMAAAELAAGLPPGPAQTAGLEFAVRAWAEREPVAALRWAAGLAEPIAAGVAQRAVAESGARQEPRALLDRIAALPESAARADLRAAAAAAWARRDAEAAIDWLRAQREEPRLVSAVAFAVAQAKPDRASELAAQLPEGRDRWLLLSMIGQTWVALDRGAALAWAGRLPAGAAHDAAFAGIETGLGVPAVRRRSGAPGQRGIASRGLGGGAGAAASVASVSSPEFEAWLATQPPGRDRDEALVEFVRQRGPADTGAIGQWLASLPGSPARERAREIYVEGRLATAPAEAAAFLRSLPRSEVNDAMLEQVARRWLVTNPDAAETWLRDSRLPDFQKDRLLREAGR